MDLGNRRSVRIQLLEWLLGKPPEQKQLKVHQIETDLSRIQHLSQEHDDENWEFRSWLKQNAPDNIDGIVQALSQKYFALIDCTQ